MQSVNLKFSNVSFSYDTTSEKIVSSLTMHIPKGWTGIVGANGTGKTTIAKLATGLLVPHTGSITASGELCFTYYCSQETEFAPEDSSLFIADRSNHAGMLRSILGIEDDWACRWETLSHGERKRFQTGLCLWLNPDILALDEPTNHLDTASKRYIADALITYQGTGIIISHDRELLDRLCIACLFVSRGKCIMRPGGVSAGMQQEEIENKNLERISAETRENYLRINRSTQKLKEKESGRNESLSKKNIDRHDHDAKSKVNLARLTGKDKTSARKIKLMENKRDALKQSADDNYFSKRKIEGFTFSGEKHRRHILVNLPGGKIELSPGRYIIHPDLVISREDRIGITGGNGTGKSTLLTRLRLSLDLHNDEFIYIPQEISRHEQITLRAELDRLNGCDKGRLLSVIYRLGSEPERIIDSPLPSPGEARKIMLGLGLLKSPSLILMDEPTNHMDLPSVLCLEEALKQFTGAMVIVSHDLSFLRNIVLKEWNIINNGEGSSLAIH